MLADGSRRYRKTTSSSRGLYVFTPRRTSLFRTSRRRAKRALLPLSKQSEIGIGWRHQDNALTELGIVCSLSSGRIVANPDITPIFPNVRIAGEPAGTTDLTDFSLSAELTGIPAWPDHRVDASKWRKCKRPPNAQPRRPPHSLSEVPIPASCRSPLDLQMRSCLE